MNKTILTILFSAIVLSACGKAAVVKVTPTPTPKLVEMALDKRPTVSLVPRDDGHMLYLKISKIPSDISSIEYEVLYTAKDNSAEIEKGLGDTIKEVTSNIERNLLLGTESCTNGCKYKYDEGVTGGTIMISFINSNGQVSTFESPFILKSGAQLKSEGELKLTTENFSVKPKSTVSPKDFYILQKNYKGGYSVYSNGTNSIVGDYPQN